MSVKKRERSFDLEACGNVHPINVSFGIVSCGHIKDGVVIRFGDYGGGVITFKTLSTWYWKTLMFRLRHFFFWVTKT